MMKDRTGEVYGRLTIMSFDKQIKNPNSGFRYYWNCVCTCGNTKSINYYCLKTGSIKSCGCLKSEDSSKRFTTHGHSKNYKISTEYSCYRSMIKRCYNPKSKSYKDYGGKGIKVCDAWKNDFTVFIKDMGFKVNISQSIDRINSTGNYEPSNCKWSNSTEQNNNKSNNRQVLNTETNETYTSIAVAARAINMKVATLYMQLTGKNPNKTNLKLIK